MWSTERLTDSDKILWGRTRIWTQAVWHLHSWAQATQPLISLSTGANLPDAQALSLGFTWIACFLLNWQTNLFSLLFRRFPAFSSYQVLITWFLSIGFAFFILFFLLLFKYSCVHFPPPLSLAPPTPTSHTQSFPSLALSLCPLYLFLDNLSPSFPLLPPLSLLSVCSLFQCLWLYFACLFCWLVSTSRWDHMVFIFHHLAYFT